MYEPATARFLSADPLPPNQKQVLLGRPNLYVYAQNDPINLVDPSGLQPEMTDEGRQRRAIRYSEVVSARIAKLELTPITLQEAIRDGQLSGAEISRLALTADEIEAILGTEFVVTLNNYSNYEAAEREYPNLPPAEAYMRRVAQVNYAKAKLRLALRNTNLRSAIDEFYGLVRGLNPVHFVIEKGYVVGSGEEPVLQRPASQVGAAVELLAYLAMLKGLNYVFGKLRGAALEPLSPTANTGEVAVIEFSNGGRLEVQKGVKFEPTEVENAFSKAAAGEKVALKGVATTEAPKAGPPSSETEPSPAAAPAPTTVKMEIVDPKGAPVGGPKDGKYISYHGTNDAGAKNLTTQGINSKVLKNPDEFQLTIDPKRAAIFGTDEAAKAGGSVKLVRVEMPEDFFLDLFRSGHIKEGATTGSIVLDKIAQAALNKAMGK